jgi:hypothetical protein
MGQYKAASVAGVNEVRNIELQILSPKAYDLDWNRLWKETTADLDEIIQQPLFYISTNEEGHAGVCTCEVT